MNELPTDFEFSEYVYKYHEIMHSGIACHVNYLNPMFDSSNEKMANAIRQLEKYANDSITAYRAIEWWAAMSIGPSTFVVDESGETLPRQVLKRITKPTHFWQMTSEKVEITE
jgi:hypothetical protein